MYIYISRYIYIHVYVYIMYKRMSLGVRMSVFVPHGWISSFRNPSCQRRLLYWLLRFEGLLALLFRKLHETFQFGDSHQGSGSAGTLVLVIVYSQT